MSLDKLYAFAFSATNGDINPRSYNYWVIERFRAILGDDSDERAYQACRYLEHVAQSFDLYVFPEIPFDNGTRVETTKSQVYSDMMISEGDHQLMKNSMSFALTVYSAGIAAAFDEDLGRAYSRRARALLHAQRFVDCRIDVDHALEYRSLLGDIETSFLISLKQFCNHQMGETDEYSLIDEFNLMNKWLLRAESPQERATRLVQSLELMLDTPSSMKLWTPPLLPSKRNPLPHEIAHPGSCWMPARGHIASRLDTLPVGICRMPSHIPKLEVEADPNQFSESQRLLLSIKRPKAPRKAPVIEDTNNENSCFSSAVRISTKRCFNKTVEVAIAARDIYAGELVAVERPWASVVNPVEHCNFCDRCKQRCLTLIPCPHCSVAMFCGEPCLIAAVSEYHQEECAVLTALLGSVQNWHRLEVATLALRMFLTFWRESNRSLDFMRFRYLGDTRWTIGMPDEQAKLRGGKIHFHPLLTTPPSKADSLKASLAAASLTYLLMKHSQVFNDPQGPVSSVSSNPDTARGKSYLKNLIQPSFLLTMDKKKFDFWADILEEDPEGFYKSGLAEALDFVFLEETKQRGSHSDQVVHAVFKQHFPLEDSDEETESGSENAANSDEEDGKRILGKIEDVVPTALDNMCERWKYWPDIGLRDKAADVNVAGGSEQLDKELAAGFADWHEDDMHPQIEFLPYPWNPVRVEFQVQESSRLINAAIKTLEQQLCNIAEMSKRRSAAIAATEPVPGTSDADGVCEVDVTHSVRLDQVREALSRAWQTKTKEHVCAQEPPEQVPEVVCQNNPIGKELSKRAGCSKIVNYVAANAKRKGKNKLSLKDLAIMDKHSRNELKSSGNLVKVDVKSVSKQMFPCVKMTSPKIARIHGNFDAVVINLDTSSFPDVSEVSLQKMREFIEQAAEVMENMKLCDELPTSENQEKTFKYFCNHLNELINRYISNVQRDVSPSSDDETCSTESVPAVTRSDESDDESFFVEPEDKVTERQRAERRISRKVLTYNDFKNVVDAKTMSTLHDKIVQLVKRLAGADRNTGTAPSVECLKTRSQLTLDAIGNQMLADDDEQSCGIVRFVPRPDKFNCSWVTRPGRFPVLIPDTYTFSLAFYDDNSHPASSLADFSKVPAVLIDHKLVGVRLPHLLGTTGRSSSQVTESAAITLEIIRNACFTVHTMFEECETKVAWVQEVRRREMLGYSAAQAAKFADARPFALPALWDDLPLTNCEQGLFYTRYDGPVAAVDNFGGRYYRKCFRVPGPCTYLPPVDTNFLFVGQNGVRMAAVVKNDFFHRLLPTKTVLNDAQGPGEATPWFTRRQRKLTTDDIYFNPTAMLRNALLPWYYDFFEMIYEHRLRALSFTLLRAPRDHKAFLKGKIGREMMEFRRRMMMPRPLLGRPLTFQETLVPAALSDKMDERIFTATKLMLFYYNLASTASRVMECTYSIDDAKVGRNRPARPSDHLTESFMRPAFGMHGHEIEDTMIGIDSYRRFGSAIYSTSTYLQHSCDPNVFAFSANGDVGVWAAFRHIRKGEQLTVSYGPHYALSKRYDRRATMRQTYGIMCECDACRGRVEPRDTKVPLVELICSFCDTKLGSNKAKRQTPRTLICPKCKKRSGAHHVVRQLAETRRFVKHVQKSLYTRPSVSYNFLDRLGKEAALIYYHVQRPNELTFALEEATKMALIQKFGNFYCTE